MPQVRRSSKALGWTAVVLFIAALASFVVPMAAYVIAATDDGVAVGDGPVTVDASPDKTWGIYFNDADNTGYSESCSIRDGAGAEVELRDPGVTVSSSETEMLDHVFTTPAGGAFTVTCDANSATVRVGPVGYLPGVLIGAVVAALLGLLGLVLGIVWLTRKTPDVESNSAA